MDVGVDDADEVFELTAAADEVAKEEVADLMVEEEDEEVFDVETATEDVEVEVEVLEVIEAAVECVVEEEVDVDSRGPPCGEELAWKNCPAATLTSVGKETSAEVEFANVGAAVSSGSTVTVMKAVEVTVVVDDEVVFTSLETKALGASTDDANTGIAV